MLLARNLRTPLPAPSSALDVRRVGADHARDFGRVAAEAFGWPRAAQCLSACVVGRDRWRHYLAYDGAFPVGCGAAYEAGGSVWLGFGGVLASPRRRGGQAMLIARRMVDAARDSHTAVVDTAEGSPSHRNYLRSGFRQLGVRPIYRLSRPRGFIQRLLRM